MTKFVDIHHEPNKMLTLPDDFVEVARDLRPRNHKTVTVIRYQRAGKIIPNNAHVTVIFGNDGRLLSYNNFSIDSDAPLPRGEEALQIAQQTFESIDPNFARHLRFMRIDKQTRTFTDGGRTVQTPILWVKFSHRNGSYNWVSVGPGGQIVEVERDSRWNYLLSRRSTEEWNFDDWVLVREGKRRQLPAPQPLG
ncbi:hypothetical protein [Furfurilactobacillus rossiae]|uniref:Uncharacterized protein n=1 Tax=Furfurilactobacillus rossiae DSM 15814 TaxID=1114972 RepID=A0A0R1RR92_9LACO|nr:hypothetical protein [Furfurilactobacillus rossiae]KRL55859.1 hypothetical protein FD35_GL002391 [Furfurilactobacillus rossiae DSM 15814]QFR67195.1 hypothetical protein LR814_08820 [Furfurilactobacillus rossiae]QLE60119.1 hypothetical protein LROSRS0_0071 [Furfurilactobacillus rossiae]